MSTALVLTRMHRVLLLVGLVFAALPIGSAIAATIGQTGFTNSSCGGGVDGDVAYTVPSGGGIINSFSFQTASNNAGGQSLDFLVLRPVSGSTYTVVGTTGEEKLQGTGGVETFTRTSSGSEIQIAVQGGDILGFYIRGLGVSNCIRSVSAGGGTVLRPGGPPPSAGDTVSFSGSPISTLDLNESANLVTVGPPSIAIAFGAATVPVNGTTSLTFTITNPFPTPQSGVAFSDTLPSGLVVSTPLFVNNTCGGSLAVAGSTISLTGGSIAEHSSCTVLVNVTATTPGTLTNTTGPVNSTEGGTGNMATATLTVTVPVDDDLALTVPAAITTNATSKKGAKVTYTATATDEAPETPRVTCTPASGSTFAIGTTTVACTTTDPDDSNSPVAGAFTVTVNGAAPQLSALEAEVRGARRGRSLLDKVAEARSQLASGNTAGACRKLDTFLHKVNAQTGKSIPVTLAHRLVAVAQRIEAVIGC